MKPMLLLSAACSALIAATPVAAQTTPDTPATPATPTPTPTTEQVEDALASGQAAGGDIVVVGSQIRGTSVTAALPVTVVSQDDLAAIGATSGDDLLRAIPQLGDVTFNASYLPNSSNAARGDVGSVNLRNLGVGNTLVLINGRRVVNHPTSRANENLVPVLTVNSNTIPSFGIERLEVLRDGAGPIYGSDAVAGVVNTVLQSDYTGVQLEGQIGFAEDTNLLETSLNLLAGTNLGDRGNITFYANRDSRTMLRAADQDYTASDVKGPLFAGTVYEGSTNLDGRSTITPWGVFTTRGGVPVRVGTGTSGALVTSTAGVFHIQPTANGGCSAAIPSNGAICIDDGNNTAAADRNTRFDATQAYNRTILPKVERYNFFANGHYDLTDEVELFGEAGYYKATTESIQGSPGTLSAGPIVIPASNYYNPFGPTGSAFRIPGLNTPAAGLAVTLTSYNFSDFGPNYVTVDNDQWRALGGLRFRAFGIDWESAALYSEAQVVDTSTGISATLLQRQLALNTPDAYNPFNGADVNNPSLRDATPSNRAAIDAIRITTTRRSKATLALIDLKGSKGDLLALPGGNLGAAFGVEVRRETQLDDRDPRVDGTIQFTDSVTGFVNPSDLVGTSNSPDTGGRRNVHSAYLELAVPVVSPSMNIPFVHRLEFQLAGRAEHYSDAGSVAKPKIAGAWDIVEGLRLRGSYAESFRAPNLEQVNARLVTRSNTRLDPIRCEAQLRRGAIATWGACGQSFATTAQRAGNPDLRPEQSTNITGGIVLQPKFVEEAIGRVTLTADYWRIKQRDIVGIFGEGNALINDYLLRVQGRTDPNVIRADPTADDIALFQGSGLAPAGRVLFVKDQYRNLQPQTVSGWDFGFNWRIRDFGIGRVTANVNAAYLKTYFLTPSPDVQTLIDARAAGTINRDTVISDGGEQVRVNGKPEWRVTGSLTWSKGPFQVGGFTSYISDVDDTGATINGVPWLVEGRTTFNLYGQVSFGNRRDGEGRHRFRMGVRNLTDKQPPLSTDGFLGALYQPYARYWYANLQSRF
ncbi:TonB-dependent receptor [uncultured Sphingomonas sp.]|uniref:TonB-dependent receptor plug domain-containing protein n=1 Tax=uncultured Sphingomonas sp. TaxID=158754 RepID=UPI0025F61325|nr:TonB-dependent receptor [uncultured Sphingomonas sp.]